MILVAAPTSDKKDYCVNEWVNQLHNLTYLDYEVFVVDNSKDENHRNFFLNKGIECEWVKPEGHPVDYITASQNVIRNKFLSNNYSYLLMIESDVFVPENIIEILLPHNRAVVTIPYFVDYKKEGVRLCNQEVEPFYHSTTRLKHAYESFIDIKGDIQRCFAVGIGATLFHRSIIEQMPFRARNKENEQIENRSVFSDTYFYKDCAEKGIPVYMETSVISEHRYQNWYLNLDI